MTTSPRVNGPKPNSSGQNIEDEIIELPILDADDLSNPLGDSVSPYGPSVRSGQVWGHTPELRVAASTL